MLNEALGSSWHAARAWGSAAGDESAHRVIATLLPSKRLAALPCRIVERGVLKQRDPAAIDDAFGAKSIGLVGGVMLLANNLAGPTITLMPGLGQEAGWASIPASLVFVAVVSCICVYMLVYAMRAMPGNRNFELRVEYTDVMHFYMPRLWYVFMMIVYYVYLILTLMSYIIQTSQVVDYLFLDACGSAYGLQLWPEFGFVQGTKKDSITPFGDIVVISGAMVVVAIAAIPLSVKNLDDNVMLQYIATVGLLVISVIWVHFFLQQPDYPTTVPVVTSSQTNLMGTLLFNFAFISTMPSWVNEMEPGVPIGLSVGLTMVFVVVIYSVVGVMGAMSFPSYYQTDEDLFSKLNASGNWLAQATVVAYPIMQNLTSIPVFSIMMRYNLIQSGYFGRFWATMIAVVFPWALSVPFYTGKGFNNISDLGGFLTSSVINFAAPTVIFILALRQRSALDTSDA